MEFKKIKMREIILISIAGFLLLVTMVSNFKHKSTDVPDIPLQAPVLVGPVFKHQEEARGQINDEDQAEQKEMKDQMDKDRNQQRQIKMLKMQLEQVNLQLDNEKALTEINKLKKENTGYVKDSSSIAGIDFPSIRIIYIGGTETEKEAILSIDGISYSVKEKDRPVANIEVVDVTNQGVKVHFSAPQDLTTIINYVQN